MKAFHKNPIGLIWIWIFTYPHQLFNQTISYFIFLLILQIFFHLTANGYEGFKLTISPFNKSLFLPSKLLSLLNFINFCLYSSVLPSLLKMRPSFFVFFIEVIFFPSILLCLFSHDRISTAFKILWHVWSNYFYINIIKQKWLKSLLSNKYPCNPNFGWLHDI